MKLYYDIHLKGKEIELEFLEYGEGEHSIELPWVMRVSKHEDMMPTDDELTILKAIDEAKWTGHNGLLKHLSNTAQAVSDEYGYSSREYEAICAILNSIAQ